MHPCPESWNVIKVPVTIYFSFYCTSFDWCKTNKKIDHLFIRFVAIQESNFGIHLYKVSMISLRPIHIRISKGSFYFNNIAKIFGRYHNIGSLSLCES